MKLLTITLLASILFGCSGSPTAPTPPPVVIMQPPAITPPVTVTPTITLRGLVRSVTDGRSVGGAAVSIAFSGQTTATAGDGTYALTFVPRAGVPTTTIQIGGAVLAYMKTQDVANIDNTFTVHDVLPTGSGFDPSFYKAFVHNAYASPSLLQPLRRQTQAPRIYLRTIDDAGAPIDALTLNQTASALESVAGKLTGVFGLAGIERGTDTRLGQPGWITVRWSQVPFRDGNFNVCGEAPVGGDLITLYPKSAGCRCTGGPAVQLSVVKHELGHALGFWHTDQRTDLMFGSVQSCDQEPSAREILHARVAYSMPVGSLDP